jgi:hypothetical protein
MSKNVAVPEELYDIASQAAAAEHVTVDDFVSGAIADQLAARRYLSNRAARSSSDRFREALKQIPDLTPVDHDRL